MFMFLPFSPYKFALAFVLLVFASMASAVTVRFDDMLTINDARNRVVAKGNSQVWIEPLAVINKAIVARNASMDIDGGDIEKLIGRGAAAISVTNSSIGKIRVRGNSLLSLDNVSDLKRLVLIGNTQVNFRATDVAYNGKFLTGVWADGSDFSIRTVNRSGYLVNGLPASVSVVAPSQVPLPPAAGFFAAAMVGLSLLGRKRALGQTL
ncbi:hypothetical protein [Oceanicoccus sp. KOV_DT_Chl]|uniref:hypothetical protein n=1 Tax=Oceanicoccus sp. KOV_DT_Chl TaxID=1904639 RepID=UPI000C7DCD78|nr:hypothetical protein [Oceanicoccus sp. KOV_DT_Chl]